MSLFLAYESCKDRFDKPITFDEFKTMFADWECIPVDVKGEAAGALMCRNDEIHACIIEKYHKRWVSKRLVSTLLLLFRRLLLLPLLLEIVSLLRLLIALRVFFPLRLTF